MWKISIKILFNLQRNANQDGLDHDQEEQDEEKPTVVVLNEGDLTAEEAENLNQTSEKGNFDDVASTILNSLV